MTDIFKLASEFLVELKEHNRLSRERNHLNRSSFDDMVERRRVNQIKEHNRPSRFKVCPCGCKMAVRV